MYDAADIGWFEEPLPADDVEGHVRLSNATTIPIAVGESLYSLSQFRDYLQRGACSIVQVDVARIGGVTPWLKTAHLAEAYNVAVCPHFLMELHVALCCATPNSRWLEYIPQLDDLTAEPMAIRDGYALPSSSPGLGIAWDFDGDRTPDCRRQPPRDRLALTTPARPDRRTRNASEWVCATGCGQRRPPNTSRCTPPRGPACWRRSRPATSAISRFFCASPNICCSPHWEYHGEDFAADARKMAADPVTRQWWTLTDPCQDPFESRGEGEWWAGMREIFHTP